MSDARNSRSGSRCHARGSRSQGYGDYQEDSSRGEREGYGRRNLRSRGGEKIGWGRQGAARLDDPPLRRSRDEMDDGMGPARAMARMTGLEGPGGGDVFGRRGGNDPFGARGGMGPLGGMGAMGGLGGRDLLGSPMMGRNPLGPPQPPMFNPRQPFAEDPMSGLRQRGFPCPEFGMESPLQDRFMGARPGGMLDPLGMAMRSPFLGSGGSLNPQAMDRPRTPYGPFQGSPMQSPNRLSGHPNYRQPYVEDYEGSEMDAEMAAHHQAAMQQQMQMMQGGGANPFFFDEGQYGDPYAGMGPIMSGCLGGGGMVPGIRSGGMMGGIHQ